MRKAAFEKIRLDILGVFPIFTPFDFSNLLPDAQLEFKDETLLHENGPG